MNKNVKVIGLTALAVGALVYPAMRLYKAWSEKRNDGNQGDEGEEHMKKAFAPTYLTNHKPHHRKETNHLHQ